MSNKNVEDFIVYLKAGYPYFYINTQEMGRTIKLLNEAIDNYKGNIKYERVVWDIEGNLQPTANGSKMKLEPTVNPDPIDILIDLEEKYPVNTILLMKNHNWFISDEFNRPNPMIVQRLQNAYSAYCGKNERRVVVVVSDAPFDEAIPGPIRNYFMPIEFDLPTETEIGVVLDALIKNAKKNLKGFKVPNKEQRARLIDAALGQTLQEVENAFSACLLEHRQLKYRVIDRLKARQIEKIKGVYYREFDQSFDNLKGYENAKDLVLGNINHPNCKGFLFVGPPGTGKTFFTHCVGATTGMRVLEWEMAEFQGGIIGETESNVRNAIKAAVTMSGTNGVIIIIDELEKGLAGVGGQGTVSSDSVTKRSASQILKFMENPGCNVKFMATSNDITGIPPEYLRAERWDTAPIYVDLPNKDERKVILEHYKKFYSVDGNLTSSETEGWSGAELKAVCRLADMRRVKISEAEKYIVPIADTMDEQIKNLRDWALPKAGKKKGRCIPATIQKMKSTKKKLGGGDRAIDYARRIEI